jgi:hypothetical protein
MDLSSKDFSLNFHGFEHDDPETVKRFTAFCEANFALSPDQVTLLKSNPDSIVLTHGGSLDELEALAKVLREIGALVEVSAEEDRDLPSLFGAPSTQELHRLFGAPSNSSNDDAPLSCAYPPPLGRSLYLLSNSNAVVDRRSLRRKTENEANSRGTPKRTILASHRTLLAFSLLTLGLGVAALSAAAILLKKEGHNQGRTSSPFSQSRPTEPARGDLITNEDAPPRTLTSTTSTNGLVVELKVIASQKALSVSSLTFTPQSASQSGDGITIKRLVGEPTFLTETAAGEWQGTMLLSIFLEDNGIASNFTTPAEVEVRVSADRSIAHASVRTRASAAVSDGTISITRSNADTYAVSGIILEDLSLS